MDYQHFLEESLACSNFLAEIELHRFGDIKVQKISHKLVEKVFVFFIQWVHDFYFKIQTNSTRTAN